MMKKFVGFALLLTLHCWFPTSGFAAFKPGTTTEDEQEVALKAAAESIMTQLTNISNDSDVARIWKYADYLWEKERYAEVRKYIEAGLTFEPFNYLYQARLALVMTQQGLHSQAADRAQIVYDKAEDEKTVELVVSLLKSEPVPEFKPLAALAIDKPTVVLVTIGTVNRLLVQELQQKITRYTGLPVVIFAGTATPPDADRSFFISEVNRMRPTILQYSDIVAWLAERDLSVDRLKTDNELFVTSMEQYLRKNNPLAADEFKRKMEQARQRRRQWSYTSLRDHLLGMVAPYHNDKWLLVGITEFDLYMTDTNFVFAGTNPYSLAIISYRRFMASFNREPQNRKRLSSRLFKQFLSVFGLLNGMTRCTFPECARVFPRTLAEHDEKPEFLCEQCRQTLEKLLKIKIEPASIRQR